MSGARAAHLVRRFVTSVKGRRPQDQDLEWVSDVLEPAEHTLFLKMTDTDQAHAIEVARRAEVALPQGDRDRGWALRAALLHDVGKIESQVGTAGRVVATVFEAVSPAGVVRSVAARPGRIGAIGRHLGYPDTGASLLGAIGSDPLVRAWAAEHHLAADQWTVPPTVGRILREADDAAS